MKDEFEKGELDHLLKYGARQLFADDANDNAGISFDAAGFLFSFSLH